MGMRLEGPLLAHSKGHDIVSDGTAPGSIQVPGNKLPIILLAERQTTGGYPKIATVVSADLPALGRLTPGAKVAFQVVGIEEAESARRQHLAAIEALSGQLVPARTQVVIDTARLLGENLVSGITDGRTLD
jgi:allophanate hydrolase subunit 2